MSSMILYLENISSLCIAMTQRPDLDFGTKRTCSIAVSFIFYQRVSYSNRKFKVRENNSKTSINWFLVNDIDK